MGQYELYDTEKRDVRVRWLILPLTCHFLSLCFPTKEKEKLYVELKHILAKQPGPEVAEQLYHCQKTLQEQTKKLKVLQFISLVVVLLFLMLFFLFGSLKLDECCILTRQICVSPNETLLLQLSSRRKGILKFVTGF